MFDYKNIEAFAMVVSEGGFEKAATKLHITQSAVSQRVKLLEDTSGHVLLKRSTPPEATEAGLPLLVHYRQVKQLEEDFLLSTNESTNSKYASISIGVNADTLATWFLPSVQELLKHKNIVLDIHVDDQEETHKLMKEGKVWGCITTRKRALQGCRVDLLGTVKYGIYATKEFRNRWFKDGLTQESLEHTPMVRYNRKDDLNNQMFKRLLNTQPQNPPTFFIPSTETYGDFVAKGFCYGIIPNQQSSLMEKQGQIINLSPGNYVNVDLYWHSWNLKSEMMAAFNDHFIKHARRILSS